MNAIPAIPRPVAIDYDFASAILQVEFSDGSVIQYLRFTADAYLHFIAAESHQAYLEKVIALQFASRKVN